MTRPMPETDQLPHALYRAEQVRALDRAAIDDYGIPGAELMARAGAAAYRLLRERWPGARHVTVLCGGGNNGGDGYVVARLAAADGLTVEVLALADPDGLTGDARTMADAFRDAGGTIQPFHAMPRRTDLIVDALLGTGLDREVQGDWAQAIAAANAHLAPKLAIDIPSGLHADTGRILGLAIQAEATISFIGLKQGLFTGEGPSCCGQVAFSPLGLPRWSGPARSSPPGASTGPSRRNSSTPAGAAPTRGTSGPCWWWAGPRGWRGRRAWPGRPPCAPGPGWSRWPATRTTPPCSG